MTEINLTPLQEKAFNLAMKPDNKITRIVGYAGTGKTTVLSKVAKELGNACIVLTPTNKASQVLRDKGIENVKTIHSALYSPNERTIIKKDKDGNEEFMHDDSGNVILDTDGCRIPIILDRQLDFDLKSQQDNPLPPIALVDEASMIKPEEIEDLLTTFQQIVFFGDGFQLPPVKAKDTFGKSTADVFLDEVHRVALDNPIIRYATSIRDGRELTKEEIQCFEVVFCNKNHPKLYESIVNHNIQAICWTNGMRHIINDNIREAKGLPRNKLVNGEKIIALQNIREGQGEERFLKFYNGEIIHVLGDYDRTEDDFVSAFVKTACKRGNNMWPFWNAGYFKLKDDSKAWMQELEYRKRTAAKPLQFGAEFDYAYCLTAHKAQGSEFDNVAVFDQRSLMNKMTIEMQQRWFYTAVTRAKKRIMVVK